MSRAVPPKTVRLIPARAGNMLIYAAELRALLAHPRSRGEHQVVEASAYGFTGSSPLARGTFNLNILAHLPGRLIPARAGNIECFPRPGKQR